jgi:hypothetical protein
MNASERLLVLLLTRGLRLEKEQYREIVSPAVQLGFVKVIDGYLGRNSVRQELEQAAYEARGGCYDVLKEEFAK